MLLQFMFIKMYDMTKRIINDITSLIFIVNEPQKSATIFLPGGSDPTIHLLFQKRKYGLSQ